MFAWASVLLVLVAADDPIKDRLKGSKSKAVWHCDEVFMMNKENRTQCRGHAFVKRDDMTLRCDILEITTDEKRNPKRILCLENVKVDTPDGKSTSEKAEYDVEKEIVTLSGNPHLVRDGSEISGETIIYDLKNERLRVKYGKGVMAPAQQDKKK